MQTSIEKQTQSVTTEQLLRNWDQKKELAAVLIKSGFLPQSIKTPEQVIAIMMKGEELCVPPMEALASINVIQGKPTISPQLMLALVRRTGQLEDFRIEKTASPPAVIVSVKRRGQSAVATSFGSREANLLGLSGKDNYKKQEFTMYQWRSIAANLRLTFSDVICGMYTHEEMNPDVVIDDDEQANIVAIEMNDSIAKEETPTTDGDAGFHPDLEDAGSKKYPETVWAKLPFDYLSWMAKESKNKRSREKAAATIVWLDLHKETQPDILDEIFPPANVVTFEEISDALNQAAQTLDAKVLSKWVDKYATHIQALDPEVRSSLRRAYIYAKQEADSESAAGKEKEVAK